MICVHVAHLLKAPTGTIRRVEIDELDRDMAADLHLVSPTVGTLRLMRTSGGILVTGVLAHRVEATCSRCLESFVRDQAIELNEEFVPVIDVNTGLAAPESADADGFRLTTDHLLDLDEAIRQYSILENPLQPLCKSDCRGLCLDCAANLNLGPCGCQAHVDAASEGALGVLLAERLRQAGSPLEQE